MNALPPVCRRKCRTCPWQNDSPYIHLRTDLTLSALTQASRICHSTGNSGIKGDTGKPDRICRGARDVQLRYFVALGFLSEPTDEAWAAKLREIRS